MYVCMNPRAVANAYKDMQYIVEMDRHEGSSDSELNTVRGSNWLASYSATSWFVSNVISRQNVSLIMPGFHSDRWSCRFSMMLSMRVSKR